MKARLPYWSTMLFTAAVLIPEACGQDWSKVEIQTVQVTENIYVLAGAGGNMVLYVGKDGNLLVDTGYAELKDKVQAALKEISDKPVRQVVDTHWHFDHVGGNEWLAQQGATLIAHEKTLQFMTEERYITVIGKTVEPSPHAALPTKTFSDGMTLTLDGEEIHLVHLPAAHTDGDCLVHFRKANVLHVGDIWFRGMYPFFDVNAGGTLAGIIAGLDRALALADENTTIICGHGPLGRKAEMQAYRDMLARVHDRIAAVVKQGVPRDIIIGAGPTKDLDEKWGRSWLTPSAWVGLIYDGMTRTHTKEPG